MTVKNVRFLEDAVVRDHAGVTVDSFKAGKTYDLSSESARRWVRRGKAEIVPVDAPVSALLPDALIEEEAPSGLKQEPDAESEPAQPNRRRTSKR